MAKRITITLDEDLDRKIRNIQAKQIAKLQKSVSFSKTLCDELRKVLK